ncbi:MAG TPA: hypothetical protein VFV38_18380 [Ktedonobacteraceae bacterium]|nr:hypothetical protein [Ktedonobacteraceae bacterium]
MPEYLSVETYISYPEENLIPFLDASHRLHKTLGYAGKDVETWLAQIAWEPDGSGFSSSFEHAIPLEKVAVNDHALLARPMVNEWTQEHIPDLQQAWVSVTLAFETQTQRQNLETVNSFSANYAHSHRYQSGVGKGIASIMRQCTVFFPQALIYFTNEGQAGVSWNALMANEKGFWEFEMALIPHPLVAYFTPIPDQFASIHRPEGVEFARTSCWSVLPWNE